MTGNQDQKGPIRDGGDRLPEVAPHIVASSDLFPPGQVRIEILHDGVPYILRITRQNRLILTK